MKIFGHLKKIRSFQSRILIPYLTGLVIFQLVIFGVLSWTTDRMAVEHMEEDLRLATRYFETELEHRRQNLLEAAQMMANDKAFEAAIRDNNSSVALETLRQHFDRLGAQIVQLVGPDGKVITDATSADLMGDDFIWPQALEQAKAKAWHESIQSFQGGPHQIVILSINKPDHLAWLVVGKRIGPGLAEQVSQKMEVEMALLARQEGSPWHVFASSFEESEQEALTAAVERFSIESSFNRWSEIGNVRYRSSSIPLISDTDLANSQHVAMLFKSSQSAYAIANWGHFILAGLFITGLILFIAMGMAIAASVAMPLQQLMADALMIAAGELDTYVKVDSEDEVGRLGQALQIMTMKLKQQIAENKAAYMTLQRSHAETMLVNLELDRKLFETSLLLGISKAITRSTDSEELLEKILEKIMLAYHVDRGSILLVDEDRGVLALKLVKKLIHSRNKVVTIETEPQISLGKNEGIAGRVLDTGEPMFVEDVSKSPDFRKYENWRDETLQSMVCLPLKRGASVIGVMNLVQDQSSGVIKASDLEFLASLATHVSVVIENTELYRESVTDGMTGLFNKRYFVTRLTSELDAAKESGSKLGLLFIDIDYFKRFNDTFGHLAGDQVLIEVAKAIGKAGRKTDLKARYGGEEFAVILPDIDLAQLMNIAERLRKSVEDLIIKTEHGDMRITISVGVAMAPDQGRSVVELIEAADQALYDAKNGGRNRVMLRSASEQKALPPKAS